MSDNITTNIEADNQNEVAILIEGNRFRFWDSASLSFSIDSFDSFSFSGPWEPDVAIFREAFVPFTYKDVAVYIGGEIFLNGTLVPVNPALTGDSRTFSVGGYSRPGVLNDCPFSVDDYPIEFNKNTIAEIAETIAKLFDLGFEINGEPGARFERVAAKPEQKVLDFIIDLAKQRNFLVSNDLEGSLLLDRPETEFSGVSLKEGELPFLGGSPDYNAQQYYSEIAGLTPTKTATDADSYKLNNTLLDVKRPFAFEVKDAENADLQTATKAKMSRMFGDSISIPVNVQGWRDPSGEVWQPNKIIKLLSPGLMVYKETEFLIRNVSLTRGTADTATLELVLPESYSGEIPGSLPWQE